MDKRNFLKTAALIGVASWIEPISLFGKNNEQKNAEELDSKLVPTAFTLPPLVYEYDALEPHIDKQTMEIHHSKHHNTYVTKLNEAIAGKPYEKMSIEQILSNIKATDTAIRNNGGGHFNHTFFWNTISPKGGNVPMGKLGDLINSSFGSFDKFKEAFTKEATSRFGSGWVWLHFSKKKGLFINSTPNQDNMLMTKIYKEGKGVTPIIALDVWEHAYYLKYQNKRADYIAAFWNVVDWQAASLQLNAIK